MKQKFLDKSEKKEKKTEKKMKATTESNSKEIKKPNYNQIAESKFSMEKEVFFKKYSNATRELGDKKEMFQKRCQLRKEKLTKVSMAKVAYSESKGKKSC